MSAAIAAVRSRPAADLCTRCAELEQRADDLERANRELAAFAAHAAHDLRSPVQVITGFAELLSRRAGVRLDETSQGFLAHILTAASGMKEILEAVLDHRESSAAPLTMAPVDCHALVVTVVGQMTTELDDAGAEVEIQDLPQVHADRVQLGRVFQNLLGNAVRAAAPDRCLSITVGARAVEGGWEFSVTDNGTGVAPEDRQRIFDVFERGSAAGADRRGRGLGLPICRAIVERHGGRIAVERRPSGGSRFAFFLPDPGPLTS